MDAAYYALQIEHMVTPFGAWLSGFPDFLKVATSFVWYLELLAPLLLFCPIYHVRVRILALVLLFLMHGMFLISLKIGLFPWVDFTSLLLFIPSGIWNRVAKKLPNEKSAELTIYYDQSCDFCRKTSLILKTFLAPNKAILLPAQLDPSVYPVMQRENSWIVKDGQNNLYLRWDGLGYLLKTSTIFWPIGHLMESQILIGFGGRIYNSISRNRKILSQFSQRFLPYRSLSTRTHWLGILVGSYFFYAITVINIAEVDHLNFEKPSHILVTENLFRLNQRWDMFAPFPLKYSEIPFIPGHLRSGNPIDVLNQELGNTSFVWPESTADIYLNYRWRKYFGRLRSSTTNTIRSGFGSWVCRDWNDNALSREEQLASFELYFFTETFLASRDRKRTKANQYSQILAALVFCRIR